jgi:hypothetical protein
MVRGTVSTQQKAYIPNAAASSAFFERVLAGHRRLFAGEEDAAADLGERAIERWQWLLRLQADAPFELQVAALFQDADLLPPARQDGAAGPCGEERRGSWMADEMLADLGVDLATRVRVHEMLRARAGSPRSGNAGGSLARELQILRDADALSFFSRDCARHLVRRGTEATRRQTAWLVAGMSPDGRRRLSGLRACRPVRQLIAAELARLARGPSAPTAWTPAKTATPGVPATTALPAITDRVIGPSGVLRAIDALGRGRHHPLPATVMVRSRLAVGMLGGAGLAPTRLAPLLARAEAIGALKAAARGAAADGRTAALATAVPPAPLP